MSKIGTRLNKTVLLILTLLLTLSAFIPTNTNENYALGADDDWLPVTTNKGKLACLPDELEGITNGEGTSNKPSSNESENGLGDVLKEGSEANKVAQAIYDELTETYGTSGAFAVGWLANVKYESAFIPDRAEGPGMLRFGMDSKKKPSGAVNSANPSAEPGGGLFQFTPFTKFTDSKEWQSIDSEGWGVKNQVAFVVNSEFKGNVVMTYLRDASTNAARNPNGLKPYSDVVDWATTDDVERATWAFQSGYERPARFDSKRVQDAKELAKHFDKDSKKGDKSKVEKEILQGKSDSSSSTSSSSSSDETDSEIEDYCSPTDSKVGKFDWLEDYTGEHGLPVSGTMYIKASDLKDKYKDIEKYFLDPEKLGMTWQKGGYENGWHEKIGNPAKNQCVDLTTALAGNIWWKDGEDTVKFLDNSGNQTGNGYDTAFRLGAAYAGKGGMLSLGDKGMSKKPTKGALFSVGGGTYGHTGIVSHVFENGDIAVTEMNVTNYSGEGNGTHHDWNFGIISKSQYEKEGHAFFDPSTYGFEPNPKALNGKGSSKSDDKKEDKKEDKEDK